MKLIIDTNILISALIKDSLTRNLIINKQLDLIVPAYSFGEINKYKNDICKRSGILEKEFYRLINILLRNINVVNEIFYKEHLPESEDIMKHIHINDAPFLACAISFDASIWSDDKHFKMQNRVKIFTTQDLKNYLNN